MACNHPNCLVLPCGLELIRLAAQKACEVKGYSLAIAVFEPLLLCFEFECQIGFLKFLGNHGVSL
jgi:hypothetical protein